MSVIGTEASNKVGIQPLDENELNAAIAKLYNSEPSSSVVALPHVKAYTPTTEAERKAFDEGYAAEAAETYV